MLASGILFTNETAAPIEWQFVKLCAERVDTMTLEAFFKQHPKVALGFSGGVDSSFLLHAAKKYGADVRPYFIKTQFQPDFELQDAHRLAEEMQVPLTVLHMDALKNTEAAKNDADRCYHCKKWLFGYLKDAALSDGYTVLIDGNNASDDTGDRPGMKAAEELEVLSPLRLCGLTKADVRRHSKEAGLFTWNKPAYACLATRVPTGTKITAGYINMVGDAEKVLAALGFWDFRVRLLGEAARIQVQEAQMEKLLEKRAEIIEALPSFSAVLLDLMPRPENVVK